MNMMRSVIFLGLFGLAGLTRPCFGGEAGFESGPMRTHLLELFTSEGCSSCPPAEAWLSQLKEAPGLWRDFVPVAFHVDYWDRLGWRDSLAAKQWTARQYEYSARWKTGSVYTPGFVLDGREWRNHAVPESSSEKAGVLRMTIVDREVKATFAAANDGGRRFDLHVARLGFDLRVKVQAGENSGRNLQHDFVVRSLTTEAMTAGMARLQFPESGTQTAGAREAIAAWVTESGELTPIQAVGGWLH
jgi:hypothetical protein